MYRTVYEMNDIPKVCLGNLWKANKKPVDGEKPIGADGYAPNYIPPKVYPANLFTTYSEDMHFGNNFDLKKEADSEWWGIATTEEIPSCCEGTEATICDNIVDAIFGFLASHTDPEDAWEDDGLDDELDIEDALLDDLDYDPDYHGEIDLEGNGDES